MSNILREVRARGFGQDFDVKVTIEKSGFFGNKRKVYGVPWGKKEETWCTWEPIEFVVSDLTEEKSFGEYQKYYEAYIKERDEPVSVYGLKNNFHQRNHLEFSPEWNTDLDIIKLYILINTEKHKEDVYEWDLIEDPIKGEKGGPAPYYRSFSVDSYYLNNGVQIRIDWENGLGGEIWSDDKGNELDIFNPKFDFGRITTEKSSINKRVGGIWLGDDMSDPNIEGKYIHYAPSFYQENPKSPGNFIKGFSVAPISKGNGRDEYGGLVKDQNILEELVRSWKMNAVGGYEELDIVKNIHGTPVIYLSDAVDYKRIEYKSPFGTEIGPTASVAGPSTSEASATASTAQALLKPTIEGIKDGFEIAAKTDLPKFTIYAGDPKKDWPKAGAGELPEEGEEFENLDGPEVLGEEYLESPYTGPEEEEVVVDGTTIKLFSNEELRRDDSKSSPDGSGEGVSFGGSDVVSPKGSVSSASVNLPADLKAVRNSKVITTQSMGNGTRPISSDITSPDGGRISGSDVAKSMNEFVSDVLAPFATWLKSKYPGLYKGWYITSATRGYVPSGGSLSSQHMKGQAIDSQILGSSSSSPEKNIELCNAILEWYKSNPVGYGQILFETRGSSCWIHWSYSRGAKRLDFKRFSEDSTKRAPANKSGYYVLPPLTRASLGF